MPNWHSELGKIIIYSDGHHHSLSLSSESFKYTLWLEKLEKFQIFWIRTEIRIAFIRQHQTKKVIQKSYVI